MAESKIKSHIDGMTAEMRVVYLDFYGNEERLKSEWTLCSRQYEQSVKLGEIEVDFASRMAMRKLADYWSNRRNALISALDERQIALVTS
jgi:hypothetical protein